MHAATRARAAFESLFHAPPAFLARAPGRVNLIGEHLDYNAGHVLPFAIDLDCAVAVGRSNSSTCKLVAESQHTDATTTTDSIELPIDALRTAPPESLHAFAEPHHWSAYVLGVLFHTRLLLSSPLPAFNATITTDVPLGGGLSSSASLEVALARALLALTQSRWNPHAAALACQRAEHDFAHVPCGLMDQLTSAAATAQHALLIDCSFRTPPQHIPLRLSPPAPDVSGPCDGGGASLLIIDSGVRHALATSEFADRVATCKSAQRKLNLAHLADLDSDQLTSVSAALTELELRAVRHVSTEEARVHLAVAALRSSDFARLGQLMLESHASLRDDYRVTCPELDAIVECASHVNGVFGARMTGGGFGGCAIALARPGAIKPLQVELARAFRTSFARTPRSFIAVPSAGASVYDSMP